MVCKVFLSLVTMFEHTEHRRWWMNYFYLLPVCLEIIKLCICATLHLTHPWHCPPIQTPDPLFPALISSLHFMYICRLLTPPWGQFWCKTSTVWLNFKLLSLFLPKSMPPGYKHNMYFLKLFLILQNEIWFMSLVELHNFHAGPYLCELSCYIF